MGGHFLGFSFHHVRPARTGSRLMVTDRSFGCSPGQVGVLFVHSLAWNAEGACSSSREESVMAQLDRSTMATGQGWSRVAGRPVCHGQT